VVGILNRKHVLSHAFDDEMSRKAWSNLVTQCDYSHSVFLQSDLDAWAEMETRIDDALLAGVREKSAYVFRALQGAPGVEGVTGMGLMIGIKTVKPAGDVVRACMEKGVLCLTAKDKVRLLPALNIPMEVLEKAVEIIKSVCAE